MTSWPATVRMAPLDHDGLDEKYAQWVDRIAANHSGTNHRVNDEITFTPLGKPLSECRVGLVSTAGAHLADQEPFHVETVAGDASHRVIPNDVDRSLIRFSHTHYDTSSAEVDSDVVLPIGALNEAAAAGRIGSVTDVHIGMMGFNPDPTPIVEDAGPAVAHAMAEAGADLVLLVPG